MSRSTRRFPASRSETYSPLVGERPFRRPANSGTLFIGYTTGPFDVALSGYFVGTATTARS